VKDPDVYAIALIGDSMFYGSGVKQKHIISTILEEKLNAIRPTKIYNLSLPGDTILNNYTKYKLAKQYLDPNLYVFAMVDNDLFITTDYDKYGDQETYFRIRELCTKPEYYFDDWWKAGNQVRATVFYPPFLPQYSNTCYLEHVLQEIDNTDEVLFLSFGWIPDEEPTIDDSANKDSYYHGEYIYYHYARIVEEAGYDVLNPIESGQYKYVFEPVSNSELHPSKRAHNDFANLLYNEITTNNKWGFGRDQSISFDNYSN
jgi:hypothetical protein